MNFPERYLRCKKEIKDTQNGGQLISCDVINEWGFHQLIDVKLSTPLDYDSVKNLITDYRYF